MSVNRATAFDLYGWWWVSDRMILVKQDTKPLNLATMQVYASTTVSDEYDVAKFYENLKKAVA